MEHSACACYAHIWRANVLSCQGDHNKLMPGMAPRVSSTVHLQVLLLLLHHAALSTQVGGNLDAADFLQHVCSATCRTCQDRWQSDLRRSEPPWEAPKVPFCTYVRSHTQQDNHFQFLDQLQEAEDICHSIPCVLSRITLVVVPWYVQLQHAHSCPRYTKWRLHTTFCTCCSPRSYSIP